jgi:hypothetical protein
MALNFFRTTGIVDERELPYRASDNSPDWPLYAGWENRVYKISANDNWISATTHNIKYHLSTYGPLVTAMHTSSDWYWPVGGSATAAAPIADPPGGCLAAGADDVGDINHAVVIVGYEDDPGMPEGGYWIVRNSWGSGWGDDGYGYIKYGVVEGHHRVHAVTGDAWYVGPAPGDFDFNALVGMGDFSLFSAHYGLAEDDPEYDPVFDLDYNGVIAQGDWSIFSELYGTTSRYPYGGYAPASAPEPAALSLVAMVVFALMGRNRKWVRTTSLGTPLRAVTRVDRMDGPREDLVPGDHRRGCLAGDAQAVTAVPGWSIRSGRVGRLSI